MHTFQTYSRVVPDPKSLFFRQQHTITGETLGRNRGKGKSDLSISEVLGEVAECCLSAAIGLGFLICFRQEEGAGGKMRADFTVIWWEPFIFPIWQGNCLKSISWKVWVWPHLPHLPSNSREGLGSYTKPFFFSLSHFPFSQATVSIEVCLFPLSFFCCKASGVSWHFLR